MFSATSLRHHLKRIRAVFNHSANNMTFKESEKKGKKNTILKIAKDSGDIAEIDLPLVPAY